MALKAREHTPDAPREQESTETVSNEELLHLLDADYTQELLAAIETAPRSARQLARECEASRPTIYRRLNSLQEAGLVRTEMELDGDGHHRTLFESCLDRLVVAVSATGGVSVTTETHEASGAHPDGPLR